MYATVIERKLSESTLVQDQTLCLSDDLKIGVCFCWKLSPERGWGHFLSYSNNSSVLTAILVNAVPLILTSEEELSAFLMFT